MATEFTGKVLDRISLKKVIEMNVFAGKAQGLVRYSPVLPVILVILWAICSMAEHKDYLYCIESLSQDDRLDLFHWQVCNHGPSSKGRSFPNSKLNAQGRALSHPKALRKKKRCRRKNLSDKDISKIANSKRSLW